MANATYEFMRANVTEEMRRVLGAKAANVQLAVPPTLAAGDWNVDSEGDGEGSSGDLHDGVSESDNNNYHGNHDEWFEGENGPHRRQAIKYM